MASSQQLHREHQDLVAQKAQLSGELDSMRTEYEFYKKELTGFRSEYEQKSKELAEQAEEVRKAQATVKMTLARTEIEIQKNIEQLNDVILEKQSTIKYLDSEIAERQSLISDLARIIKSLESDIASLQTSKQTAESELDQLYKKMELSGNNLAEIDKHITDALADLQRISTESANLTKLKHDLDMYYMRIKNYYKKAGLHFVDEQYVGTPSN